MTGGQYTLDQHGGFNIGLGPGGSVNDIVAYLSALIAASSSNIAASKPSGGSFIGSIYYPPVVLYFYNYDRPALIQIYQNGVLVADSTSAQNLTQSDITLLTGSGGQQWFNDETQFFLKNFVNTGGGYVTYAGKINFNYNPANGSNFTVVVTSPTSIRWRYVVAYPIDGASVGCVPPTQTYTSTPTFTANYTTVNLIAWCGNGGEALAGSINVLTGFTETWSPFKVPAPTVSAVPFDISQDWYASGQ